MKPHLLWDVCWCFISAAPAALLVLFLPVLFGDALYWERFLVSWPLIALWLLFLFAFAPQSGGNRWLKWPWLSLIVFIILLLSIGLYCFFQSDWLAWIIWATLFSWFIWIRNDFPTNANWLGQLIIDCFASLACAAVFIGLYAIETRFSEEEFFLAVKAFCMALIWLTLFWGLGIVKKRFQRRSLSGPSAKKGIVSIGTILSLVLFSVLLVSRYHQSFYPQTETVPYNGISYENPIQCFSMSPTIGEYRADEVYDRMLSLVETNPNKATPEFGMLALGTKDIRWAQTFRDKILEDAKNGLFTGPVNSIKVGQYDAALRVYYYWQVKKEFSKELFSLEDQYTIQQWLALVNKRTLTVEWIDWLYAFAFNYWPIGPYENQENGAGLLALLEVSGLSDPNLSSANRAYLDKNPRGWQLRFRNTDDAITYQPTWINNAYFQYLYTGKRSETNMRNSFEWIVAQAPPNAVLQYNHPKPTNLTGTIYLGAIFLKDPSYLWLAGRGVDALESSQGYLYAQPGSELSAPELSAPVDKGDCLMYGDSGLPNQVGPLSPDKIVFRGGWENGASYLLLNLRFSGWHLYKGTGSIIVYYLGQPLVNDVLTEQRYFWLPAGRNQFRDKRIPRENLNALSVKQSGLGSVIYALLGGSPWAQNPPVEARVVTFEEKNDYSKATIVLDDWHGWKQDRTILRVDDGIMIVSDSISGPDHSQAALFWHIFGNLTTDPTRFRLGDGKGGEMVIVNNHAENIQVIEHEQTTGNARLDIQVDFSGPEARLITAFLSGPWEGAQIELLDLPDRPSLRITKGDNELFIPLSQENANLSGEQP